jgi:hypothetical protein
MKKITLTRSQLVRLWNHITKFDGKLNKRFVYTLARVKSAIRDEIYAIHDAQQTKCDAYTEYQQEYALLTTKYAMRNDKDEAIIVNGLMKIRPEVMDEAKKALTELNEKYKDAIDARNKEEAELDKLLEEKIEIDIIPLSIEHVPEELTVEEMEGLELIME